MILASGTLNSIYVSFCLIVSELSCQWQDACVVHKERGTVIARPLQSTRSRLLFCEGHIFIRCSAFKIAIFAL